MTDEQFQYIISRIVSYAIFANTQSKYQPDNEFEQGRREAYYEVLNVIKNQLEINDQNLSDYKLDFDLESEMW